MANLTASVDVEVHLKAVQDSPELQNLLRELIKQELAHLSSESVQVLTDQIVKQYETRE